MIEVPGTTWQVPDALESISPTQAPLLGLVAIAVFVLSALTAGRIAKRLEILDAGYDRALWATLFKNLAAAVAGPILTIYVSLPFAVTLVFVTSAFPIIIYRRVFLSTWGEAVRIWAAALAVEIVSALTLTLGALWLGAWLERTFLTTAATVVTSSG